MAYRNATRRWRAPGARHLSDGDWKTVEQLVANGLTDLEIAERIGCSSKTIARWRWNRAQQSSD